MNCVLPPKRFEDPSDPLYDSIRTRPWFAKMATRRAKIPLLKQAHAMSLQIGQHTTQKFICDTWGVDERELRDYVKWYCDSPIALDPIPKNFMDAINHAYHAYCEDKGNMPWRNHLRNSAPYFGIKPRHITEKWETDTAYYPDGYEEVYHAS